MSRVPLQDLDLDSLPRMVRWYSPRLLLQTAGRHIISGIFAQFADQRIMQATIDGFSPDAMQGVVKRYDCSAPSMAEDGAVWVDYVADLGDGFDSTYAIASLISADHLDIEGAGRLPAGKILIMGGDQVYPYPSRQAYRERFILPYSAALPETLDGKPRRQLFVLPGNHDWYDGLSSFDFTFCKARFGRDIEYRIAGWKCPQHRSYFAIRLPNNWWIWGADIQLSQYLDAGQILYFGSIAEEMNRHPTEAPKVILCIAEPSWNYEDRQSLQGEANLDTITQIALNAGARICGVIAGDLHHYSRYVAPELGLNLITCGGGGAYFSPTHYLPDKQKLHFSDNAYDLNLMARVDHGKSTEEAACWPSRGDSRWLTLAVLAFPFRNYGFSVWLATFYWLMTWLLSTTRVGGLQPRDVSQYLAARDFSQPGSFAEVAQAVMLAASNNVMLGLGAIALWVVLFLYADPGASLPKRLFIGTLHWLAHITMMVVLLLVVSRLSGYTMAHFVDPFLTLGPEAHRIVREIVIHPLLMVFIGAIPIGFVWGAYLTISCLFNLHCDQAFSSMGIPHYKNFLRFKIEPDKLTIYAIGLKRAPPRRAWRKAKPDTDGVVKGSLIVPSRPLKPELIDGPIEVRVGDIRRRERRLVREFSA